ncbi:MAG: ATP-binding protein [Spirochaetes bacterium]|nr:ATP-binding protein [Spirochaetota bacterium]MBN2772220.1 ATP-binding protein [Spirochaetota bacterium]
MKTLERLKSLDLLLVCGLYGAGKNELAQKYFNTGQWNRVSRNEIRKLMFEMTRFGSQWTAESFNEEDDVLVKHIERKILEHYLHNKRKVLVINTFATIKSRQRFLSIAKNFGRKTGVIYLNMPLDYCLSRYKKENPTLPETVIRSMYSKTELPDKKEGFEEVLVINPKEQNRQ